MKPLPLSEIEQTAKAQQAVVNACRDLQVLVDKAFPGYTVVIAKEDGTEDTTKESVLQSQDDKPRTALDAAKLVLSKAKAPVQKHDLLKAVNAIGFSISIETLSGYLSRDPDFENAGRGLWKLYVHPLKELRDSGGVILREDSTAA